MKDLTIRKADKGSCIVVEDTSSYVDNGIAHLQNTSIYRMLSGDPTNSMSKSIGDFVEYLFNSNYIDKHTHSFLKPPQSPRTQRLYFTEKLHKNPTSIRPIVSGCSGPTEKISAFLDHHLKPLIPQLRSYTRDSGHIVSILETTPFPKDCILVAIHPSNLYLNIPQDERTAVCLDALQDHDLLPMPRELLQTLFDIVLKCNVFSFSTHTFQQTQGTAMGTKMAPSYANFFMGNLKCWIWLCPKR